MLKPQDIVILLKILSAQSPRKGNNPEALSQNNLAMLLCISPSEVNAGIKRLVTSKLLAPYNKGPLLPIKPACLECLIHAVLYFIPAKPGEYTRGIPTAYAAPIFDKRIVLDNDPIPVWPHAEGSAKGLAVEPLYRSVPSSLIKYPDPLFYDLLVLVDAIRIGRAREREIAAKLLTKIIEGNKHVRKIEGN